MKLKYDDESKEDAYVEEFWNDTNEYWTQIEQPTVRDVIKWAIIKGYLK